MVSGITGGVGPLPEAEVLDAIDRRAPGRRPEVITYAQQRGLIRRIQTDDHVLLEAVGTPQNTRRMTTEPYSPHHPATGTHRCHCHLRGRRSSTTATTCPGLNTTSCRW